MNRVADESAPLAASPQRYAEIRRITLHGAAVNAVIATLKLTFGFIGQSQALIADGVHSLSDLSNDFLLIFAAKHASRAADAEHPYGHGRIETVFSVAQGLMLGAVGIGIGIDAVRRLFNPELLLHPELSALLIALLALACKETLYHYTMRAAKRLRSSMLRGNAWDHRSDAISSLLVVVGVGGSLMGLAYLDAVAAVAVALMVAKIGWNLIAHSVRDLIDTGLEEERVAAIRRAITSVNGVRKLHNLRTRRMGPDALVDVHIQVDPSISVSEGHYISDSVRSRVMRELEEVQDVLVHIDPEDDERTRPSSGLPSREEVMAILFRHWQDLEEAQDIEDVTLHYLDGKIHVDVLLPLAKMGDLANAQEAAKKLSRLAQEEDSIAEVRVRFY